MLDETEDTIESLQVGCKAWQVLEASDGHVLYTSCTGGMEHNGTATELIQPDVMYHLDDDGFVRIDDIHTREVEPFRDGPEHGTSLRDFRVVNFDSVGYHFEIVTDYLANDSSQTIHGLEDAIDEEQTVIFDAVTRVEGEYETTFTLDTSRSASIAWHHAETLCCTALICCILPDGSVHALVQSGPE